MEAGLLLLFFYQVQRPIFLSGIGPPGLAQMPEWPVCSGEKLRQNMVYNEYHISRLLSMKWIEVQGQDNEIAWVS